MKPLKAEKYTPARKAEFLLANAVDEADFRGAQEEVRKLGLDPDKILSRESLRVLTGLEGDEK